MKQRSLLLSIVNYLIFLYNLLSTNEIVENVIHDDHLKTNVRQNDFFLFFEINCLINSLFLMLHFHRFQNYVDEYDLKFR